MSDNEKNLDYYLNVFGEHASDANEHGYSVAILIENADPLSRETSVSKIYRGSPVTTVGLLQMALMDFYQHR